MQHLGVYFASHQDKGGGTFASRLRENLPKNSFLKNGEAAPSVAKEMGLLDEAISLGRKKNGAPEIVFPDPLRQELFELERGKVALRSMEHAQAGRAFNDFRAQLSVCVSSLNGVPSYPMPPRARALSVVSAIYGVVLFDTFHQHIERPYVFLPTEEFPESEDFSKGVDLLKVLLPSVSLLERSVHELAELSNKSEIEDISEASLSELTNGMISDLKELREKFDLSESSDKFRPSSLEFLAHSGLETMQWIVEAATSEPERNALLDCVADASTFYGGVLVARQERLMMLDENKRSANYEALLLETQKAADTFLSISSTSTSLKKSPLPEVPAVCTPDDLDMLRWQIYDAVPRSVIAREIALDRIQFASGEMELDEVNLTRVITSMAEQVLPTEGKETLEVIVPADSELLVFGNERRLRGALSNIISNAFHYGDTLKITLTFDENSGQAVIELKDNGKGVSEDLLLPGVLPDRPTIFDLGVTKRELDSADRKKGTGVGTTESLYVFQMHEGSLAVESIRAPEEGHGTTFTARLPAKVRRITDVGAPLGEFISAVEMEFGEVGGAVLSEAIEELSGSDSRLVRDSKFFIRREGDPLNQDFISFSRKDAGSLDREDCRLYVPESLLKIEDHGALKIILRDFLLPFEIDAQNQAIVSECDPLVRHAALFIRFLERFRNQKKVTQIGLVEALKIADLPEGSGRKLGTYLEESLSEDLPSRAERALLWASEEQLRPLALRDSFSLRRDSILLFEKTGPLEIEGEVLEASKRDLEERFIELCRAFDIHEGTSFFRLIREAVIEDKEVPLKPSHRMRYPTDSRSMLVYLTEHGLLTSVLRKLEVSEITRWRSISDDVLPLAARVLQPESDEIYEELLQKGGKDREAASLSMSIALLPLLGTRTLDRMAEVGEFLKAQGVTPLTAEEVRSKEAEVVRPWAELLDKISSIVMDTGIDEAIYRLDESVEEAKSLGNALAGIAQFRHVRSTLEAREIFPLVRTVLEYAACGDANFSKESFLEASAKLESYLREQEQDPQSPVHDALVRVEIEGIREIIRKINNR